MPLAAPGHGGKGMQANIRTNCLVQRLEYEKVTGLICFIQKRYIFRLFLFRLIATPLFSQ